MTYPSENWCIIRSPFRMPENTDKDGIRAFYSGERPDSSGRYIEEIWAFTDHQLEYIHDYIQWLFPLGTRSRFNPDAPLLTQQTILAFRRSGFLRSRLKRSIELMLKYYGLQSVESKSGSLKIVKSPEFGSKSLNWLKRENHNHLRLTRIMTSAGFLGLRDYSTAILACLEEIATEFPEGFSAQTIQIWRAAANG